jgi:hypothetical protein
MCKTQIAYHHFLVPDPSLDLVQVLIELQDVLCLLQATTCNQCNRFFIVVIKIRQLFLRLVACLRSFFGNEVGADCKCSQVQRLSAF